MMKKKVLFLIPAAAVLLILCVLLCCLFAFETLDVISVSKGLCAVSSGEASHYEISSAPNRLVIAGPDNAYAYMVKTLEAEGYAIHEEDQMGAMITISKDGIRENLIFSVNGNYSLWRWTE